VLVGQRDRRELFRIKMFEVKRQVAILLELACALLLVTGAAPAFAATAELAADVPAGKWKALRLRGLPQGASLAVRVETSGPIMVFFVHQEELKHFPEKPVRPAFSGSVERRLAFRVSLPLAGDYYVILDNRKSAADREVRVRIDAAAARKPRPKEEPSKAI
jgi:hypothetical protein